MKRKIRVGSRESKLAVKQAEIVMDSIRKFDKEIELELVTMKTIGDKILDKTLDKIGGKGLFIKELEKALLDCKIDICVHSYKDMQITENELIPIIALGSREDARDVQIFPANGNYDKKPIGTSSARRSVQLRELDDNTLVEPIRGNVLSRLEKLDRGEFSSIILAYAGVKRLGLENRISKIFSIDEMLPASCQGIISVQGRKGENIDFLNLFDNEVSRLVSSAEREFVRTLGCDCSSPVAAHAVINGNELKLTGLYYNEKNHKLNKGSITGEKSKAKQLGEALARELI